MAHVGMTTVLSRDQMSANLGFFVFWSLSSSSVLAKIHRHLVAGGFEHDGPIVFQQYQRFIRYLVMKKTNRWFDDIRQDFILYLDTDYSDTVHTVHNILN